MSEADAQQRRILRNQAWDREEAALRDKKASADKAAEEESDADELAAIIERWEETGNPYDKTDRARLVQKDRASLKKGSVRGREATALKDTLKRVDEAFKHEKLRADTHLEEKFDEIVASVEAAYDADAKNNTTENIEELEAVTEAHTERVLDREMQEGTSLDTIRHEKAARS